MGYVELEYFNAHCNPHLAIRAAHHRIPIPRWRAWFARRNFKVPRAIHGFDWTAPNGRRYSLPMVVCQQVCAIPPGVDISSSTRTRIINKEMPGHQHFCVPRRVSYVSGWRWGSRKILWEAKNPLAKEYRTLAQHQQTLAHDPASESDPDKYDALTEANRCLALLDAYLVNTAIASSPAGAKCPLMAAWLKRHRDRQLNQLQVDSAELNQYLDELLAS